MSQKDLSKLHEDIGYIKGKVEKIDSIDSRLMKVEQKVSNILGYATAVASFFSLVIVFVKDWISRKLQ